VIRLAPKTKRSDEVMWVCACDCGNTCSVRSKALRNGVTRSCGCLHKELLSRSRKTHGMSETKLCQVWSGIKKRCINPRQKAYADYGGRGIRVCDRWIDSFDNFLLDMGLPPGDKHTIDRIDNDGDYEPSNCRWATRSEQARNKRNSIRITLYGKTLSISDWADETGLTRSAITQRISNGWSVEDALTKPRRRRR